MPKLSIIVPVWNTLPEKLDKCLKSIFSQKDVDFGQIEVLVVDSSDTDAQQEVANNYPCKIVRSKTRLMLGVARNAGHKYSTGEYLWFVDADDWVAEGCLSKILHRLDGKTDIFFAPFKKLSTGKTLFCEPTTPEEFAVLPVAAWNKVYRREHYAQEPNFMPEDVAPHYLTLDKCSTAGYFDFECYVYDDTPENKGGISRTFDFMKSRPMNLLQMAIDDAIPRRGLRDEYVVGVVRNIAYMYERRNDFKNEKIKKLFMLKFAQEWQNFMSGFYIH